MILDFGLSDEEREEGRNPATPAERRKALALKAIQSLISTHLMPGDAIWLSHVTGANEGEGRPEANGEHLDVMTAISGFGSTISLMSTIVALTHTLADSIDPQLHRVAESLNELFQKIMGADPSSITPSLPEDHPDFKAKAARRAN